MGADPRTRQHAALLSGVDLFSGLDRVALSKLAAHLETHYLAEGDVLMREGEAGDRFYLIADGSLGVFVTPGEGLAETRVQTLRAGDPVGEMALLTNTPRSATVRADTASEVLCLDRTRFMQLAGREASVSLAIALTLSRRLNAQLHADAGAPVVEARRGDARPAAPATGLPGPPSQVWSRVFSRQSLSLVFAAGVLLAGWQVAPPSGLAIEGWRALVAFIAFLPAIALDAMPEGVIALALVAILVLGGVVPTGTAMVGFASANWILVICVLVVGAAMASTGILYRLALWTVARFPKGFASQTLALALAGLFMSPAVPHAAGRVMFLAPLIQELVEALGYEPRARPATGLAMAALIGCGMMVAAFMTSSTTAILVFALVRPGGPADLNWLTWAIYALPMTLVIFLGTIGAIVWLYRPRTGDAAHTVRQAWTLDLQKTLLGPPSRGEKVAATAGILMLLGFLSQPWHGLHPAWIAVAAILVLAAARIATVDTLRAVNWSFVLMFGMLASLSPVLTSLGADDWLGSVLSGLIGDLADTPFAFLVALTLLCFVVSLFVRFSAGAPLVTIVFVPVAAGAGINPLVIGLIATVACNAFFLPKQNATYQALYNGTGSGRLFTHAQAYPVAILYGAAVLAAVCLSVPFWRAAGLL